MDPETRAATIRQAVVEMEDAYTVLDAYDRGLKAIPETADELFARVRAERLALHHDRRGSDVSRPVVSV